MADLEPLRQALAHYEQQREQVVKKYQDELRPIDSMIWQLKRDLGEATEEDRPQEEATAIVAAGGMVAAYKQPTAIKPDEFFMMNQTEAAKAYLKKVGHSVPFDDLVAALRKGGAKLGGKDPKKTLYVSLARNPRKEFVWPNKDYIGLPEFYTDRSEK